MLAQSRQCEQAAARARAVRRGGRPSLQPLQPLQGRFRAAAEATGLQPAACARRSLLCACELADDRRGAPTVGSTSTRAQAYSTSATEALASSSSKVQPGAVLVRCRVEMRRAARHRL